MSKVYVGIDQHLDRPIILKFLQRLPLTFELANLAPTLGVRHGLVILDAQQYHSGGCLVGGTSVKGGIVFERVLICYGPVGNISASSGLFILLDMARLKVRQSRILYSRNRRFIFSQK